MLALFAQQMIAGNTREAGSVRSQVSQRDRKYSWISGGMRKMLVEVVREHR